MPFEPIILDLQGFCRSPLKKTLWKSFVQILRTSLDEKPQLLNCSRSARG